MLAAVETPSPCPEGTFVCAEVWERTGNRTVAEISNIIVGVPLALLALFLLGAAARWLLHRAVEQLVARAGDGPSDDSPSRGWFRKTRVARVSVGGGDPIAQSRRVQRAKTMGSVLKSVITAVVIAVVGTMMLSEVGVNIAPIIASAGIVGLALGFGAQSLVKDYLSGIFMIFEDQYGVGDVVDVGEAIGTVEAVTLRVTRLRSLDGTVWYVPNGEILRVGNMSQNWSRAVVDVAVGYGEDLARVKRVLHDICDELWRDDDFGQVILEEPEVTGVEMLAADSVNLRILVKTVPLEQWRVARELRQRIKARFDHEGIEIPFAQRVVWHRDERAKASDGDQDGSADPTSA